MSSGGSLSIAGNWTKDGTFTHSSSTVRFNGTSPQTIGGSSISSFFDVFLEASSTVIVPVSNQPTVAGTLTNNGTLQQTQTVGSNTDFLKIGNGSGGFSYYGVNIANGSGLGSTTVSVSGNQICSLANGYPVRRCFVIDPATTASADVTFYYSFPSCRPDRRPQASKPGTTTPVLGRKQEPRLRHPLAPAALAATLHLPVSVPMGRQLLDLKPARGPLL